MTILSYDAETVMPKDAGARYSEVMGTLSGESYHLLVNEELKALVKEILQRENEMPALDVSGGTGAGAQYKKG